MSAIAKKKAQAAKGPELILIYMGYVFVIIAGIFAITIIAFDSVDYSRVTMVPLIYFCVLAGLSWGIATGIRNGEFGIERKKDWLGVFIFIGILVGAILAAYSW